MTSSKPTARSARASSATAAKAGPNWSRRDHGGWGGTSGIQYLNRNVRIRGEEKFLPDARQKQSGLFTLQTLVSGPFRLEGGAAGRVQPADGPGGRAARDAGARAAISPPCRARSAAVTRSRRDGAPACRCRISARAPAIDELFANGPHGGSQAFEVGDPDLDPEKQPVGRGQPAPHHRPGASDRATSITAASRTSFSRRRPAKSRTICRSTNSARARPNIMASSSRRRQARPCAGHRLGRRVRRPTRSARPSRISARRRKSRRSACSAR